jgi:hypothetical protein
MACCLASAKILKTGYPGGKASAYWKICILSRERNVLQVSDTYSSWVLKPLDSTCHQFNTIMDCDASLPCDLYTDNKKPELHNIGCTSRNWVERKNFCILLTEHTLSQMQVEMKKIGKCARRYLPDMDGPDSCCGRRVHSVQPVCKLIKRLEGFKQTISIVYIV